MFQKKATLYKEIPAGLAGQLAEANIATSVGCVTISDAANKIKAGDFIIGELDSNTKQVKYAKACKGNINNKPILGVVLQQSQKNPYTKQSVEFLDRSQVMYLTSGSVYIETNVDAPTGYYVHIKTTDGSVAFDANITKADYTFTRFCVAKGGKANSLISIKSI